MSDDLVDRLRLRSDCDSRDARDAVTEIVRLRANLKATESIAARMQDHAAQELAAERERWQTALQRLADAADDVGVRYFDADHQDYDVQAMQAATIAAREVLRGEQR